MAYVKCEECKSVDELLVYLNASKSESVPERGDFSPHVVVGYE